MARFIDYRRNLKQRSRTLRRDSTRAERKLWFEFLRDRPEKFTRQKPLGPYVADFYCSARTAALSELGVRVIRFTNEDVMLRFEGVCLEIIRELRN